MGSALPDEMPAKEAAQVLGVTLRTLREMVHKGLLQPAKASRVVSASTVFSASEVTTLADLRFKKLDLGAVANMAMRAYVTSKSNEKRLNHITDLLGLNLPVLATDEASVVALVVAAQNINAEEAAQLSVLAVRKWAATLYALDEPFLRLVAHYTGMPEPWSPFFDSALLICVHAPRTMFNCNKDLEAAYAFLEAARRHLRSVMYFYHRTKWGRRAADRAFPEMQEQGIDVELTTLLYPG